MTTDATQALLDLLKGAKPMACGLCKNPKVMIAPVLGEMQHRDRKVPAIVWAHGDHWRREIPAPGADAAAKYDGGVE